MRQAALCSIAGIDPMVYLKSDDPVEQIALLAIARHYFEIREDLDRNLAIEVVNQLGQAMKK